MKGAAVTELSLGGAGLGNLYEAIPDSRARHIVDAAWDLGIRTFDTAPHYGLGLSERRLGDALRGRSRHDYVVSTKVGRLIFPNSAPRGVDPHFVVPSESIRRWDFTRDGVRRSLEESLDRLGIDRVDIAFVHDPDDHWRDAVDWAVPALEELRAERIVSAIGVGMNQTRMLTDFVRHTDIDVVMLAGRYTLLDQSALEDLLPSCVDRDVAVINAGVFNSGILASPDPGPTSYFEYTRADDDVVQRARRIAEVCQRHQTPLPTAAIHFAARHPAVVSIALGADNPDQVTANVTAFHTDVPDELWRELRDTGLIHPESRPERETS